MSSLPNELCRYFEDGGCKYWFGHHYKLKSPCPYSGDKTKCFVVMEEDNLLKRKDEEKMEKNTTLEKTLDMAANVSKIAANLSEVKKEPPKPRPFHQTDDNSNKATTGSQSVNVIVDKGPKKEPKPVEKHIHTFPENRALTSEECELAYKKAQMDYDLKLNEHKFQVEMENRKWQHDLELERKNDRKAKIRGIFACILAAVGIGSVGYSVWADYRDHKNPGNPKTLPETAPVKAEGDVK